MSSGRERGVATGDWSSWLLVGLLEKPVNQAVGAAAVGEAEVPRHVARGRREIEALVLLVAAGERASGKIPREAENTDALLGRHALGAGQIAVDQRPQLLVGHLRCRRRGEYVVRADQAQDLVHPREPDRQDAAQHVQWAPPAR